MKRLVMLHVPIKGRSIKVRLTLHCTMIAHRNDVSKSDTPVNCQNNNGLTGIPDLAWRLLK
jgi:hypothetical protein